MTSTAIVLSILFILCLTSTVVTRSVGLVRSDDKPSKSFTIPMLFGDAYYLTIGIGDGTVPFEKKGVEYVRPTYSYAIMTLEEVMNNDVFPITRFTARDGTFAIDTDFIPPCLLMSCDKRFEEYRNKYAELLRQLGEHPNLKEGEGKQTMLRYMFRMQSQDLSGQGIEFLKLTQEVAQAVDYFIMRPNTDQTREIPTPLQVDPGKWLKWLEDFMTSAVTLADGVELIDDSIDYEALLAQAKKELYEQLSPELYEKLLERIKTELNEELYNKLNTELTKYMEEVVKPELGRILSQELYEKLYEKLYTELFENLFNALYVTMPEEKEYIPQI